MQATIERSKAGSEQFDYETRRYYDTVTWLAEVLPGSMRTPFEYTFDGHELYAKDGSALEPIFDKSIEEARLLPNYEQRRRHIEKAEYCDMLAMMQGDRQNTTVVLSDFPPELMDIKEDVGGYSFSRKQTMLRVLIKTPENTLQMYSQSLDGSNRRALESIYEYFGDKPIQGELLGQRIHAEMDQHEQEFLIDQLTNAYDRSMQAQFGSEWYAGRLNGQKLNTYDFVCKQTDLVDAYLRTTDRFTGGFRDYALAAAVRDRFLARKPMEIIEFSNNTVEAQVQALAEMNGAGNRAQALGMTFSGCGASIEANQNTSGTEQLSEAGYGNKSDKPSENSETLVWKDGTCRIENCPTRPHKTKVAQCSVCRCCQAWFDKGRDPAKLYKGIKRVQETAVTVQFGKKKETKIKK